ncbi:PH domain-containing protein [Actinoplanes sp. NPDC089786]|uniref:PH domain-containing protein n=1 Tax=Actinoplanes sp. NPDC089786 TaxID=3155185 RepID=UPI003415D8BC
MATEQEALSDEQVLARARQIQNTDPDGAAALYRQLRGGPLAGPANLALGAMFLRRGLLDGAQFYLQAALTDPTVKADAFAALADVERRRTAEPVAAAPAAAATGLEPAAQDPGERPLPSSVADVLAKKDLTDEELRQSPGEVKWARRPVWWSLPPIGGGGLRTLIIAGIFTVVVVWTEGSDAQHGMWLGQLQRLAWAAWPSALLLGMTYAWLRWWTTRYTVYERRVEVQAGVLFRVQRGIWLYDVERPVYLTSDPWQTLTGTATVVIESERLPARSLGFFFQYQKAGTWGQLKLAGFGVRGQADEAVAYLTRQILRERRALKDRFV